MVFAKDKICRQFCQPDIAYKICPGEEKTFPICTNCCKAKKDCKLFGEDGHLIVLEPKSPLTFSNRLWPYM